MGIPQPAITAPSLVKHSERLTQVVIVFVAIIAATGAVAGFLGARASGTAGGEARAGIIAWSQANELSVTVGRILDADFDYISEAEILAVTAMDYQSAGLIADADHNRNVSRYLLVRTYAYNDEYYSDADVNAAVDLYATSGFTAIWAAYNLYRGDLNAEVAQAQALADDHLTNASNAGRRADGFLLSVTIVAVSAALGTMAVATKFPRVKVIVLVVGLSLYSFALANLLVTTFA